jgi:hypothetical protein
MSDLPMGLPFHPEGNESPDPEPAAGAAGRSRGGRIPTVEECLLQLAQLNLLVLLGHLSTARANAIRGNIRETLQHHARSQAVPKAAAAIDAGLLDRIYEDPTLLQLVESFLSDEQVAALMQRPQRG